MARLEPELPDPGDGDSDHDHEGSRPHRASPAIVSLLSPLFARARLVTEAAFSRADPASVYDALDRLFDENEQQATAA